MIDHDLSRSSIRRIEQHRDRWSSYGSQTGIRSISEMLSAKELRDIDILSDLDDRFLEKISPDVSIVQWADGAVLFEQGTYLDLAFYVLDGEVEVSVEGIRSVGPSQAVPIFDAERTSMIRLPVMSKDEAAEDNGSVGPVGGGHTQHIPQRSEGSTTARHLPSGGSNINFLASFDFDLAPGEGMRLGSGELFGEIGAMSGWPQSGTARTVGECRLLQIRLPALRNLKRRSKTLGQRLDALYRERALRRQLQSTPLFSGLDDAAIRALEDAVELVSLAPGEVLVREGDAPEALYMVRSGFLRVSQRYGQGELVSTYLSKGMTLGEMELLVDGIEGSEVTATSVEYAELVKVPKDALDRILRADPRIRDALWRAAVGRLKEIGASRRDPGRSSFVQSALDTGLVQGNSILMIDLEQCTRCDDCVRACAATHGGRPRFVREGERLDNFLIARSCYHCRDPVCLVGCPTGAIHRSGVAEVIDITDEICIGCATCANNCPYDAIVMHDTGETWADDMLPASLRGEDRLVASKCDLCSSAGHDPACVTNCPQGCAFRVGSVDDIRRLLKDE